MTDYKAFDNPTDKILIALLIGFWGFGDLGTTIIGLELGLTEKNEIALAILEYGYFSLAILKITLISILLAMTLWLRNTDIREYFLKDIKYLFNKGLIYKLHAWAWDYIYLILGIGLGFYATVRNIYYIAILLTY